MEEKFFRDKVRETISDFVDLINKEKEDGVTPTKYPLNFRNWRKLNKEVDVYNIKTEYLLFRKDNGRISTEVETYERFEAPLIETSPEGQNKIREFLWNLNPDGIRQMMSLIKHDTQTDPAIITCDGFLVNGNRRKLAIEKLYKKTKDERYLWMKVVILPDNTTNREIEEVENRYQYYSDGKEEYSNFAKAISIRRKERYGMTLEMQLLDDPEFASLTERQRRLKLKSMRTEYIGTLGCIDSYLDSLGRPGMYRSVADGVGDRHGRWEAFTTFHKAIFSVLKEGNGASINVNEQEVGKVLDAAFKVIRKRDLSIGRLNDVMRKFPKMLKDDIAKKEILKLADEPMNLTKEDITRSGQVVEEREQDKIWDGKYGTQIIRQVKLARDRIEAQRDREIPLDILNAALKKLNHDDLDLEDIKAEEIETAMEIVSEISDAAENIYTQLDKLRYKKSN